jgi:RNA polymerase sigma factor (sigma-70 family)
LEAIKNQTVYTGMSSNGKNSAYEAQLRLLESYCEGNNTALFELFAPIRKELFFIAYRYVQSEQDAEDVVSDCFEKLLFFSEEARKQRFVRDHVNFKHFVCLMIRNRSLDFLKVKNNRQRIVDSIRNIFTSSVQNESKKTEDIGQLHYLIAPLSLRERTVILMDLEGYSLEDIAHKMGVSKKTISNVLYESRKKLKLLLDRNQILGN